MAVNIVTGRTGTEHITSDDFRAMNASVFGTGKYVFDYGQKFAATIVTNNQIRIRDGMCMNQGTQMGVELTDYVDVAIENGISGSNRNDLIVMRYERNADTSIEKASLVAIKGTSGSVGEDPEYNTGNILDGGDLIDDMPLFRVKIESLTITAVEPLFTVFDSDIRKKLAELSNVDNTADADKTVNIAKKLSNEKAIGSAKRPVYFNENGVPVAGTYTLGDACQKSLGEVNTGDTGLVTGGQVAASIGVKGNYEEKTWTPSISHYYGDEKYANVFSYGEYKKVGNIVHIKGMLELQSATPSISEFCLKDLPYNPIGYISKEIDEIYAGHVMIGSTSATKVTSGTGYLNVILPKAQQVSMVYIDLIYWI